METVIGASQCSGKSNIIIVLNEFNPQRETKEGGASYLFRLTASPSTMEPLPPPNQVEGKAAESAFAREVEEQPCPV